MKKQKGITLIALIITIIILIILSAVVINLAIGENGIIEKAKLAKEETSEAQSEENAIISNAEGAIDEIVSSSSRNTSITKEEYDYLKSELEKQTNRFNPNKTLSITDFTDTKTEQTYTIPYSGWLFINATRNAASYTISFYRNDMQIFTFNGAGNNLASNSVYVPVNKGDIIRKAQNNTGFKISVNLYYNEVEENS